jgi:hypothetical protein
MVFRMALGAVVLIAAAILAAVPASGAPSSQPPCPRPPALPAPDQFVSQISNRYLPLTVGTTWTYKGKPDGKSATDVFAAPLAAPWS